RRSRSPRLRDRAFGAGNTDAAGIMSILKVARMGHPVLREVAGEVDPTTVRSPAFQKLIDDMIETMVEYDGIGLAAPQVHESVRLFVAGVEGTGDNLKIVPF